MLPVNKSQRDILPAGPSILIVECNVSSIQPTHFWLSKLRQLPNLFGNILSLNSFWLSPGNVYYKQDGDKEVKRM